MRLKPAEPKLTVSFDHSCHLAVPPRSTAARGHDDPAAGEGSTGEFDVDRWIERRAADAAVGPFHEYLVEDQD